AESSKSRQRFSTAFDPAFLTVQVDLFTGSSLPFKLFFMRTVCPHVSILLPLEGNVPFVTIIPIWEHDRMLRNLRFFWKLMLLAVITPLSVLIVSAFAFYQSNLIKLEFDNLYQSTLVPIVNLDRGNLNHERLVS